MSGRKKPSGWGSELPDDPPADDPSYIDHPIATTGSFDLAKDPDPQIAAQIQAQSARPDPDLTRPPTTEGRRFHLIEYGAGSALCIAGLHIFSLMSSKPRAAVSLIQDHKAMLIAHAIAIALGVALAAAIWWRHARWACYVTAVWAAVEVVPNVPNYLYGEVMTFEKWFYFALPALGFAAVGVAGAKAEASAESMDAARAAAQAAARPTLK